MSKLYIEKNYGVAPTILLNEGKISFKAKGLFTFLQSKPSGWAFSIDRICKQGKDEKDSVRSGLRELESHGYLSRRATKGKEGRWTGYDYLLSDKPLTENPTTDKPLTEKGHAFSKKDNSKKDNSKKESVGPKADFVLSNYLNKMKKDSRHIQVIAMWIKQKGLTPESEEQARGIIKRNLRPAKELAGYKDEDIIATIDTIKNAGWLKKWTLETVLKFIDEVVALRAKSRGRPKVRFEQVEKNGRIVMRAVPV